MSGQTWPWDVAQPAPPRHSRLRGPVSETAIHELRSGQQLSIGVGFRRPLPPSSTPALAIFGAEQVRRHLPLRLRQARLY